MSEHRCGFGLETDLDPAEAETRMRKALADEGFGILTEIDVAATLKTNLDVDVELGTASSAPAAHNSPTRRSHRSRASGSCCRAT